jgi:hypothetical protein
MGRIADLCSEIAENAEEGPEGLTLSPDLWDRLRDDWEDEDIEDALNVVRETLLNGALVESADSLSARLLEVLGAFGAEAAFKQAEQGKARIPLEAIGQLARRVAHLEEILEAYREGSPPDRRGFDALQRRLALLGIEPDVYDDVVVRPAVEPEEDDEE